MKKIIAAVTGIVLGTSLSILGTVFSSHALVALAAENPFGVKQSQYVTGVWGDNNDGEQIVIALYNNGKQDIAYITDGKVSFYDVYTMTPTTVDGAVNAQHFDVGGAKFTYCEVGKEQYIIGDDGDIYAVENLSAYEAEQIRQAF